MMKLVRDWRLVVASVFGAAIVLVGIVRCDSGEEVVEPAVELVRETATATVIVAQPTATMVPATPTSEAIEPTATATVEVAADVDVDGDLDLASLTDRVHELTIMLAEELSPRQSATEEELRAAEFLLEEMEELGYEVELQDFEVTEAGASGSIEILEDAEGGEPSVKFSRPDGDTARIFFLPFEPVMTGEVEGELVYVGLGDDADYEEVDVEGKIALISRGTLTFEEKETNAAERGAIGVVVFNNEPRFYFGGRLEQEPDVLVGGIPKEIGETLRDVLDDGEELNVELLVYPDGDGPSRNVVAEMNNDLVDDQVVLIGAHYDTTPWSAGANDNGSGVASALIVAEELADDELPFDLRFVFFGSEETGLHGSRHYAYDLSTEEIDRIAAMINLDVVATGDVEAFGSAELTEVAEAVADDLEIDLNIIGGLQGASSDHAPFDERGVPYVMFYADDLRFINDPADTLEHVDPVPMGQTVAIVLELIDKLAESMEP